MPISEDSRAALALLKEVQNTVLNTDDLKANTQVNEDLRTLISVLESPVFQSILNIQDSLRELKRQVNLHPSILPEDFDITSTGDLILNLPTECEEEGAFENGFQDDETPVQSQNYQERGFASSQESGEEKQGESGEHESISHSTTSTIPFDSQGKAVGSEAYQGILEQTSVGGALAGRQVIRIQLFKPEGKSLGFSVVGLRSEHQGELGIYVQEIQADGIAGKDGELQEGDQILAIDSNILDSNISHQQAISILQKASGNVELVVARGAGAVDAALVPALASAVASGTPIAAGAGANAATATGDSFLPSDWCQVEVIDLKNDGTGLGFGIIGGQQTGVVVKTILPGGVADRDGRLLPGDFILQINEHWLRGVASEQVAAVLRGCGVQVRLVVARPVDPTDLSSIPGPAPILPTVVLSNQQQLETHLQLALQNEQGGTVTGGPALPNFNAGKGVGVVGTTAPLPTPAASHVPGETHHLPEIETLEVELSKDNQGLGITIAGYTCEREELSGIFVKSVTEGSAAHRCGKVMVNDQIVEVDGNSLHGYTNQEAVEMLRATGTVVRLKLVRYVHGLKFEQLQQAIANSNANTPSPQDTSEPVSSTSPSSVSSPVHQQQQQQERPVPEGGEAVVSPTRQTRQSPSGPPPQPPKRTASLVSEEFTPPKEPQSPSLAPSLGGGTSTFKSPLASSSTASNQSATSPTKRMVLYDDLLQDDDYSGELRPDIKAALIKYWSEVVGPDYQIIVAQLSKFKEGGGLGISLEGTVEKVDGAEQNPHHYIRSVLPNGPVGQNGLLLSGDELLEVNGKKLLGMYHADVVGILKDLPMNVRIVCSRPKGLASSQEEKSIVSTATSGQGLTSSTSSERMVKAKSDGSLTSSVASDPNSAVGSKAKSKSLEPLTAGLAMWSDVVETIELIKTDKGLGFSILDYQDPLNPQETVIVIRSLVPGGVAQMDGRLIPGDRLMFVNEVPLGNASLDTAVQALKGAQQGVVRIGVSKPLPVPESQYTGEEDNSDCTEMRSSIVSEMETDRDQLTAHSQIFGRNDSISEMGDIPPPLPTSPIPEDDDTPTSVHSSPTKNEVSTSPVGVGVAKHASMTVETRYEERKDLDNIPPLPEALEQRIKIIKDTDSLGLQVDIEEGGVNGMVVRSLTRGGTLARDARIQPGDYLVTVNGENLRCVSQTDALAVLRRTQLVPLGSEIAITYIPATDAVVYRTSVLTRVAEGVEVMAPAPPSASVSVGGRGVSRGATSVTPPSVTPERSTTFAASAQLPVVETNPGGATASVTPHHARSASLKSDLAAGGQESEDEEGRQRRSKSRSKSVERPSRVASVSEKNGTTVISIAAAGPEDDNDENETEDNQDKDEVSPEDGYQPHSKDEQDSSAPLVSPEADMSSPSGADRSSSSSVSYSRNIVNNTSPSSRSSRSSIQERGPDMATVERISLKSMTLSESSTDPATTAEAEEKLSVVVAAGSDSTQSLRQVIGEEAGVVEDPSTPPRPSSRGRPKTPIGVSTPPEAAPRTSLLIDRVASPEPMPRSFSTPNNSIRQRSSSVVDSEESGSPTSPSKQWGPERTILIHRNEPGQGLGISIVGGRLEAMTVPYDDPADGSHGSSPPPLPPAPVTGIFIKNVLPGSPAAATGQLSTGDRILAVGEVDLRNASHEKAVEAIRQAGNPLKLMVQSLRYPAVTMEAVHPSALDESLDRPDDLDRTVGGEELVYPDAVSLPAPNLLNLPPPGQDGTDLSAEGVDTQLLNNQFSPPEEFSNMGGESSPLPPVASPRGLAAPPSFGTPSPLPEPDEDSDGSADDIDQGPITLENGLVVDKISAACLKKLSSDDESEDEFGYTSLKIQRKYGKRCPGSLLYIRLNKGTQGLGISLAGHKDRLKMAVIVAGLNPKGNAARDGNMQVGDIILEVNGLVLLNRSHLNASSVIKNLPEAGVTFIVHRPNNALESLAPKPVLQFPTTVEENPMDRYIARGHRGLREVSLRKGDSGLGIMIIEGKHPEAGTGVFISDLQTDSVADKAGLLVGDMILAVNGEDFVGASYETAARVLKKIDGEIKMIVSNPNMADIVANAAKASAAPSRTGTTTATAIVASTATPIATTAGASAATVTVTPPVVTTTTAAPTVALSPEKPKLPPKPALAPKPVTKMADKDSTRPAKDVRNDPTKCAIAPGQDTIIEIIKDKDVDGKPMGLGLSIVGGSDTLLGAIFIHEVYEAGAAHKDGRLRPGDQILEVMKEDLRNVTHSFALHALRQTPNKVRLVIHREDDEIYETLEVELVKKRERGLGLSIVGKKSGPGVFISEVVKGGAADVDGRLVQGDQIITVNGHDLKNASQEEAAPILKMAQGKILMSVRRLKVGNRDRSRGGAASGAPGGAGVSAAATPATAAGGDGGSLPPNVVTAGTPKTITLTRGQHNLGFSIVGGFGSPHGDMPVFVRAVFEQGAAADHGGLKRGDQILAVNGKSLEGVTHQEAVSILKGCEATVHLKILS